MNQVEALPVAGEEVRERILDNVVGLPRHVVFWSLSDELPPQVQAPAAVVPRRSGRRSRNFRP